MNLTQQEIDTVFEKLELQSEDDRQKRSFAALSSLQHDYAESVIKTYATYSRDEQ